MRFSLTLLIFACLGIALQAQTTQKERTLYERITKPDKTKTFDPATEANIGGRSLNPKTARTKGYATGNYSAGQYRTKDFSTDRAWDGDMKFATKEANTKGSYETRTANVKTAPTKDAREAGKTAATRPLWDGERQYLGPERKKLDRGIDPSKQTNWRSMVNTGRTYEESGELKPLTVEDIRELLNKNK